MAELQGRNSVYGFGTHSAPTTIVDRTALIMDFSISETADRVEANVWGTSGYKRMIQGWKEGTLNITFEYTPAIWTVVGALKTNGTEVDFEYGPSGDTTGDPSVTGSKVCLSREMTDGTDGVKQIETTWAITAEPTEGTFA